MVLCASNLEGYVNGREAKFELAQADLKKDLAILQVVDDPQGLMEDVVPLEISLDDFDINLPSYIVSSLPHNRGQMGISLESEGVRRSREQRIDNAFSTSLHVKPNMISLREGAGLLTQVARILSPGAGLLHRQRGNQGRRDSALT